MADPFANLRNEHGIIQLAPDFQPGQTIGNGARAEVYLNSFQVGNNGHQHVMVALKKVYHSDWETACRRTAREATVLSRLQTCPYIVRFYGLAEVQGSQEDGHYLVIEYMDQRDLMQYYRNYPELAVSQRLTLALDIARGIAFLHHHEINLVHNDIKSLNIFLTSENTDQPRAKLGDFGMSNAPGASFSISASDNRIGSVMYLPPEQWASEYLDKISTFATDIYAFGVVLTELASWQGPYGEPVHTWIGDKINQTGQQIGNCHNNYLHDDRADPIVGYEPKLWGDMPEWFRRMTMACLDVRPAHRPKMSDVVRGLEMGVWPPPQDMEMS
ncbi:hypothetical protein HDU96_008294 [Phlyctochytrium bullatum]|nr:hypothetical protein HDU96_008294 [Phlyctochytrium bullatum]